MAHLKDEQRRTFNSDDRGRELGAGDEDSRDECCRETTTVLGNGVRFR